MTKDVRIGARLSPEIGEIFEAYMARRAVGKTKAVEELIQIAIMGVDSFGVAAEAIQAAIDGAMTDAAGTEEPGAGG